MSAAVYMAAMQARGTSPLDRAKAVLTIPDLWVALGLPGPAPKPGAVVSSPFREDKKPSFSIFHGGQLFKDFSTGDTGGVVKFVALAKSCDSSTAAKWLIEHARTAPAHRPQVLATKAPKAKTLRVPNLTKPAVSALAQLAAVRRWPMFAGCEIAAQGGLLWTCDMIDDGTTRRAWAITDSARRSVQVRRLDGQPWAWNKAKAWTLGGSLAGWPIGAADIGDKPTVFLTEGTPDFLAAITLAWMEDRANSTAVVCLPGATQTIHSDALPNFAGKHVRICEQSDTAGEKAGRNWAAQLIEAGATVDGFTMPAGFKDLADVLAATGDDLEPLINLFEEMEGVPCP